MKPTKPTKSPWMVYDDAGNLIDDGVNTFTYDAHGMLQTATGAAGLLVTNAYDHARRRTVKDSATGTDVSHTWYTNSSLPWYPSAGKYEITPPAPTDAVPCCGGLPIICTDETFSGKLPARSLASTLIEIAAFALSSTEALSATAIGPSNSGARRAVRKIAVGPSAPPMMAMPAAWFGSNPSARATM